MGHRKGVSLPRLLTRSCLPFPRRERHQPFVLLPRQARQRRLPRPVLPLCLHPGSLVCRRSEAHVRTAPRPRKSLWPGYNRVRSSVHRWQKRCSHVPVATVLTRRCLGQATGCLIACRSRNRIGRHVPVRTGHRSRAVTGSRRGSLIYKGPP